MLEPTLHQEVERKFDVPASVSMPSMRDVVLVSAVTKAPSLTLDAIYFDTADLALHRAGVTLRLRTGGGDDGWHVKLPSDDDDARTELGWPADAVRDAHGVPDSVRQAVVGIVGGTWLLPVARIRTHRKTRVLHRGERGVLAELVDDRVETVNLRTLARASWREWEVELGDAAPTYRSWRSRVLNAVERALTAAGATRSTRSSKAGTVLDDDSSQPAGAAVATAIARLTEELAVLLPKAIRDEPDAVHQARVRIRKIRSVISVYHALLRHRRADRLRRELRALGWALADSRDLEVLAGRAEGDLLANADPETRATVVAHIRAEHATAHSKLVTLLQSRTVRRLIDRVRGLAVDPPGATRARSAAETELPRLIAPLADEVSARLAHVMRTFTTVSQEEVHTLRKRARRMRYAGEAVLPALDDETRPLMKAIADAGHDLQDVLGEYRDDVIFAEQAESGIHPAIAAEIPAEAFEEMARAARERGRATVSVLPERLEQLDRARAQLTAALYSSSGRVGNAAGSSGLPAASSARAAFIRP